MAKLYDRETPITAADLLNDRVLPFYGEHDVPLSRILPDRGTERRGAHDRHGLCLAVEGIAHSRTKTESPQTDGIVERFPETILDEFHRAAFRRKIYTTIEGLQADLDPWMVGYDELRPRQGRCCFGKTPVQASMDATPTAREKAFAAQALAADTTA